MKVITPKHKRRLQKLSLLCRKMMLDIPKTSKHKHHKAKLWYNKFEKIRSRALTIQFRYEHLCPKCKEKIIPIRWDYCLDCKDYDYD